MPTKRISLDVYLLNGLDWKALSPQIRDGLYVALRDSKFQGNSPARFGLTEVRPVSDEVVFGHFNQEYSDELHRYDDSKQRQVQDMVNSVDLLWILIVDRGVFLLQDRRFHEEEKPLSMDLSRQRLHDLINRVLRDADANLPLVTMDSLPAIERSKEEFLQILRSRRVVELEVDGLENRPIPREAVIFNPRADRNQLIRQIYAEFEAPNLATAKFRASSRGNLGRSKFAASVSEAGEPRRIRYEETQETSRYVELRRRVTTH